MEYHDPKREDAMRKPFGQKQTKSSKADKAMIAAKRTMPSMFQNEGYEWIERPSILDDDIVKDPYNKRVVADSGKYVLQYYKMDREDFYFTFSWAGKSLNINVGINRAARQPYPFFVDYAYFGKEQSFRFETTQELKRIFSIIAVCLEKYSSSSGVVYEWPQFKHSVRVSMPQGYRRVLAEGFPNPGLFSWKAILSVTLTRSS